MNQKPTNWLKQLSPEQRARVKEIIEPRSARQHSAGSGVAGFWLRCSPSTGTPTDVLLFLRTPSGKVLREWRIWPREGDPVTLPERLDALAAA